MNKVDSGITRRAECCRKRNPALLSSLSTLACLLLHTHTHTGSLLQASFCQCQNNYNKNTIPPHCEQLRRSLGWSSQPCKAERQQRGGGGGKAGPTCNGQNSATRLEVGGGEESGAPPQSPLPTGTDLNPPAPACVYSGANRTDLFPQWRFTNTHTGSPPQFSSRNRVLGVLTREEAPLTWWVRRVCVCETAVAAQFT